MPGSAHEESLGLPTTPGDELDILTLPLLKAAAREFSYELTTTLIPSLYGVTDGKAVGTFVEGAFNTYIAERYRHAQGNAAKGIDFPSLGADLKVTSTRQPQSSCPFEAATQKVYGLGYHLLVMVYEKVDDHDHGTSLLKILHVIFIDQEFTADFLMTKGIADILEQEGNADDIDAFLEERNLPLDEIGRRLLAERIVEEPPRQGYITISNALQWRLQYGRAISLAATPGTTGLEDLVAE
jgi:restriction system protein